MALCLGLRITSSGFTCSVNEYAQTCQSGAGDFATFPVVTCQSGSSDGLTEMSIPTTVSLSQSTYAVTTYEIYAPMIEIRWQSSDLPANSTSSSQASTSSAAASAELSTGTKAAIGVVIPVVILASFALGILLWRRRQSRTSSKLDSAAPAHDRSTNDERSLELQGNALLEMEEQRKAHEMGSKTVASCERHELHGNESYLPGRKR